MVGGAGGNWPESEVAGVGAKLAEIEKKIGRNRNRNRPRPLRSGRRPENLKAENSELRTHEVLKSRTWRPEG